MFSRGNFNEKINHIEKILTHNELFLTRNRFVDYSGIDISEIRKYSFEDVWKYYYSNQYYDFLLNDNSIITFQYLQYKNSVELRYVYLDCPYEIDEYSEPEIFLLDENDFRVAIEENEMEDVKCKKHVMPIRYDYSERMYEEGVHPVSHIHIGYKNETRICTTKILNPISFILFIIRQIYPSYWKKYYIGNKDLGLFHNLERNLENVRNEYWGGECMKEYNLRVGK